MKRLAPLWLGIAAALAAVIVVVLVVTSSGGGGPAGDGRTPTRRPTDGPTTDSPRPSGGIDEALPIGAIEPDAFDQGDPCPQDHDCSQFSVTCPEVEEPARVSIAVAPPSGGDPRGTVVLFSGGGGRQWWADEGSTASFLADVRDAGLIVVQVRWKDEWLGAVSGERAGPERLACRSATVITWIHDEVHLRAGAPDPGPGRCGFCLTGSSGGASQIGYALAYYGLDTVVDGLFPTGGPPHTALEKGCLRNEDERAFWYEGASVQTIDTSWGFRGGDGPCVSHDEGFVEEWLASNVETGGFDYEHPDTRVVVIVGERDRILPHAEAYAGVLRGAGTDVRVEVVPGMGHSIAASPDGLNLLLGLLVD